MRHQIIDITDQYPFMASATQAKKVESASEKGSLYWIGVYPPLESDNGMAVIHSRRLCPWSMAAEFADPAISKERKQHILDSFKNGQRTMKQFDLPACRIMFYENHLTKKITVWVD
jgi:hypothetical protein